MNIKLINKNIVDVKADVIVEFLTKEEVASHSKSKILNQAGFKGEEDEICFLHENGILFCGIQSKDSDNLRAATTNAIKALKASNYKSAKIEIISSKTLASLVEGIVLGGYDFNDYKSKPK